MCVYVCVCFSMSVCVCLSLYMCMCVLNYVFVLVYVWFISFLVPFLMEREISGHLTWMRWPGNIATEHNNNYNEKNRMQMINTDDDKDNNIMLIHCIN